jgi:hypothetical protein
MEHRWPGNIRALGIIVGYRVIRIKIASEHCWYPSL